MNSLKPARKKKLENLELIPTELRIVYPRLHYCPNSDYLLVNDDEPEFDSCNCFYHDGNTWYFPIHTEATDDRDDEKT